MIRLFDRNETNFNHNKTILTPLSCYVIEEANGMFELEAEFTKNISLSNGEIIKAPTPRGEQLFRIYQINKTLKGKKAYAKHIFYDLSKNFLINVPLNNISGFTAIQAVLDNAETEHNFVGISDILSTNSATYTRMNPIQAIIGDENSILNTWGGNLIRNNYDIRIEGEGTDRGYEIRLGKNLIGIEGDADESSVKTRVYPTVVLGDDDTVYSLPEKYVDSPLINNYGESIIHTVEISLTDEQKELPMNEIYQIMRDYCNDLFEIDNIDKPVINYKVNFVELSKTEQYKDLAILEQLDLYDIVTVNVSQLDINIKARVIKYNYDCLKERYESIELGDFRSTNSYTTEGIVSQLKSSIKANETAVEYATNVITGNKGGYVVTRRYPNGKPYEILIMDTEDINTAVNVLRMNNSGLGFSRNGYNGSYGTAMTIDGHIVADYIDTGVLKSIILQSSNYVANTSGSKINLADGTIDFKNFKVDVSGNIVANNATLNNGIFSGSITGGSMNINNKFMVDSLGNMTANNAVLNNATISGYLNGVTGNFSGALTGGTINIGSGIFTVDSSGKLTSTSGSYTVVVENGKIYTKYGTDIQTYFDGQSIVIGSAFDFGVAPKAELSGGYLFLSDGYTTGAKYIELNPVSQRYKISNGYSTYDILHSGNIASYAATSGHTHTTLWNGTYLAYVSGSGNFASGSQADLGSAGAKWGTVYANTGTIVTSDRNEKNSIEDLPNVYKEVIKKLKPVRFKYNNGSSNRYHTGFVSQDVEQIIDELGMSSKDLAAFIKSPIHSLRDEYGEYDTNSDVIGYSYGLRNDEFISPVIAVIQEQQQTIDNQADEINELKQKLNEIEPRLSKLEVA